MFHCGILVPCLCFDVVVECFHCKMQASKILTKIERSVLRTPRVSVNDKSVLDVLWMLTVSHDVSLTSV